ncbi:MAG: VPLPA-CTERM sorting domain-containing protein [Pseudomonadota bacterium]
MITAVHAPSAAASALAAGGAVLLMLGVAGPAGAATFSLSEANRPGPGTVVAGFDPAQDIWELDLDSFTVNGGTQQAFAPGTGLATQVGVFGDAGEAGIGNDPTAIGADVNVVVIQNYDNNDNGVPSGNNGDQAPANWDNSFNARRALEAIAANTTGSRAGFFLYWNEGLGVNRLAFAEDLSDGASPLSILFAISDGASGLDGVTGGLLDDDLLSPPQTEAERNALRGAANRQLAQLVNNPDFLTVGDGSLFSLERAPNASLFSAANFAAADGSQVIPVPAAMPLLIGALGGLGAMARRRRG